MRKQTTENHASLLMRNDNKEAEVYFWFRGNPFELDSDQMVTEEFDENWEPSSRLSGTGLELVNRLQDLERTVGYLAAGKSFLMFGTGSRHWSKNLSEVLAFFPTERTVINRITDPELEIANRISVKRRVQMARKAAAPHSTRYLPEVEFRIPRSPRG